MRKKTSLLCLLLLIFPLSHAKNETGIQDFYEAKNCDPNCTFNSSTLTKKSADDFPKSCSVVCADLQIDQSCDISQSEMASLFQNMKTLIGELYVVYTNYTSGNFLKGLETLECYNSEMRWFVNSKMVELGLTSLSTINCNGIDITGNSMMEKLNMPNIKNLTHPKPGKLFKVSISEPSPFCISTQEMLNFMEIETADVKGIWVDNYCEPSKWDDYVCKTPAKGCVQIVGDVTIDSKFNLETMRSVEVIFGRLVISGTNITDFNFLESLKYVANLDHKSAIFIEENKQLANLAFPKLKRLYTPSSNTMELEYNNQILAQNASYCFGVRKALNLEDGPKFDGFSCEYLEKNPDYFVYKKQSAKSVGFEAIVMMVVLLALNFDPNF